METLIVFLLRTNYYRSKNFQVTRDLTILKTIVKKFSTIPKEEAKEWLFKMAIYLGCINILGLFLSLFSERSQKLWNIWRSYFRGGGSYKRSISPNKLKLTQNKKLALASVVDKYIAFPIPVVLCVSVDPIGNN